MTNVDRDAGDDDRRAAPPVDPWLGSALPASPPPPDPDPFGVPAVAVDPRPAPGRRLGGIAVGVAALAAFGCLGSTLLSPRDSPKPVAEPAQPVTSAAVAPVVNQSPPVAEVVYLVSSETPGDKARVEYTDQDRDTIRKGDVTLPWRLTFRVTGDKPPLVLIAQRTEGGTGPVTCRITVDGKALTTEVQRGRSASPQCSA